MKIQKLWVWNKTPLWYVQYNDLEYDRVKKYDWKNKSQILKLYKLNRINSCIEAYAYIV